MYAHAPPVVTFPLGNPQLAPLFHPFTIKHFSSVGFRRMTPNTSTLCCRMTVGQGEAGASPASTRLVGQELFVNIIHAALQPGVSE